MLNEGANLTQKFFTIAQSGAEFILWILVILSVLSVALILERFFALRIALKNTQKIQGRVREALQSNNIDEIEEMGKNKDSIEGRALGYGLRHVKQSGSKGLVEVFNSFILSERPKLERSLTFLATVGSNGPFIGLLGTVFGIMKAFNDLSISQNEAATSVMRGIAEALVATAVGLIVAIPAVIAYNYFQRQVKSILLSLESVRDLCVVYANQKGK
ncbi:MAG: MotA/TolQ/ExbB proton channel family protein [Pseudomonadota bacterium]|nr:MotA/TolQ/ExbB proton channel family protein [Pseudomonadota bacterium]